MDMIKVDFKTGIRGIASGKYSHMMLNDNRIWQVKNDIIYHTWLDRPGDNYTLCHVKDILSYFQSICVARRAYYSVPIVDCQLELFDEIN